MHMFVCIRIYVYVFIYEYLARIEAAEYHPRGNVRI
jgi:hypothetical protein